MARSIIFVNTSGSPWNLSRFGGIVVPAAGTLDVTGLLSDDELISEIQKGLGAEFDASHYIRISGADKSAAESKEFMTPGQAGGSALLMSNGAIDDAQHGTRGAGTLHPSATGATPGFLSSADKTKLDGLVANANTIAEANSDITTTSVTAVLTTGMTLTPAAGTYLCFFQGTVCNDNTGAGLYVEMSLYAGGSLLTHSRHRASDSVNFDQAFTCMGIAVVNGSQAIEGRWRRTAGTGTAYMNGPRSLIIVRIA